MGGKIFILFLPHLLKQQRSDIKQHCTTAVQLKTHLRNCEKSYEVLQFLRQTVIAAELYCHITWWNDIE